MANAYVLTFLTAAFSEEYTDTVPQMWRLFAIRRYETIRGCMAGQQPPSTSQTSFSHHLCPGRVRWTQYDCEGKVMMHRGVHACMCSICIYANMDPMPPTPWVTVTNGATRLRLEETPEVVS